MAGIKDVIDTLDKAADGFDNIANAEQKKIYEEVVTLAKDLETDAQGKIKQTITNLKRLNQIKAKLTALSKDKEWVAGIGKFVKYFDILQKQQNAYFSTAFPQLTLGETAKKRNEMMKQIAVNNTIEALMGDGLKANVTDKLNDILLRGVTSGAKWADLQQELRDHLMGKEGGQGAFARYATTYATTALSQYTGQHNQLMTKDLGLEWFMYTGSNIETTRPFCEALTKKKWVHKSEIPTILQGKIEMSDGEVVEVPIYQKTNLPYGMIADTTPDNFQCNCGGWNCRHQLIPVADAVVPAAIRAKFEKPQAQQPKQAKPQPIDLAPYNDQVDAIEQYIAGHPKSGKIKGYLDAVLQAADNGDQAQLEAILKAAKADMSKFLAAEKSKAKKATSQKEQEEQAKKIAELKTLTELVSPEQYVDQYTYEELKQANDYVAGHMSKWMGKGKTGQALVQAIDDEINKYLNPNHKTFSVVKDALEKKKDELATQLIKDAYLKKKWKITDYVQAHPKAGKVIECLDNMNEAEKSSDMDAANGYADNALSIIKKNEGVAAYLKKKKGEKQSEEKLVDFSNTPDAGYEPENKALDNYIKKTIDNVVSLLRMKNGVRESKVVKELEKIKKQKTINTDDLSKLVKEAFLLLGGGVKLNQRHWCSASESDLDYYLSITKSGQYSTERKRKAAIFDTEESAFDYTYKNTNFRETWKAATTKQKDAVESYTRASGAITKLLRGINGWYETDDYYAKKSAEETKALTELISKTKAEHDIFIKRDEKHEFCSYRWGVDFEKYIHNMQALIGKVGTDESFMSCGNNKNTYFSGTGRPDTELRIFCPKGTFMLPAEPQGHYSQYGNGWNGNTKPTWFAENEIILQRGTKLRITDARYDKDNHRYYIACEVISQNPRDFHVEYTKGQGYRAVYD